MPENPNISAVNFIRTVYETVLFKYQLPNELTCIGEAELTIEEYVTRDNKTGTNTQSRVIRADILSVFTPDGSDVYLFATEEGGLRAALQQAAVDHYLYPPEEKVVLPKKISEW